MAAVYATEEASGDRVLVRLECDEPMCEARIAPRPTIAGSGWTKRGIIANGVKFEYVFCPDHAP